MSAWRFEIWLPLEERRSGVKRRQLLSEIDSGYRSLKVEHEPLAGSGNCQMFGAAFNRDLGNNMAVSEKRAQNMPLQQPFV
jgi:hypothetical protein